MSVCAPSLRSNSTLSQLTGRAGHQCDAECHLSERAAAIALGADSRGILRRPTRSVRPSWPFNIAAPWSIRPSLAQQMFPGVTFNATTYPAQTNLVTSALAARVLGGGSLPSQPALSTVTTELGKLIGVLCSGTSPCNNTARVMAVTAAACPQRSQCRHVDQLSRRIEEAFHMRKKSKALGLHQPLRHADHPRPKTRRQFIAQSFMTGGATVLLPSMFSAARQSAHSERPDADAADGYCERHQRLRHHGRRGPDSLHLFRPGRRRQHTGLECAGGRSRWPARFLSVRVTTSWACPEPWCPAQQTGSFVDSTFGLRYHTDSAHFARYESVVTTASAMANTTGTVIPALSQTTPAISPQSHVRHLPSGCRGALLNLIGSQSSVSGGNSMSPPTMINIAAQPTKICGLHGLARLGQHRAIEHFVAQSHRSHHRAHRRHQCAHVH